ncbi:MAG: outer membrane lipoprotein carrier protein LolA [Candidatus Aminicenantaceae bacterium]
MKRIFLLSFLSLFLIGLIASPEFCQEASNILEKMIEASGGRKVLEGIKDTKFSGTVEMTQMGLSGSMTIYHKEPNKFRQEIEVMGMVITSAFDGETAWMVNPQTGSVEEQPENVAEMTKREALYFGNSAFLNPEKYGITYALKENEKIEGRDYFVLEQTYPDGHKSTLYVDSQTYLIQKIIQTTLNQMGVEVEQEMFLSDHKKVDGVIYAHFIKIIQDGEEFGTLTITEVNFNTGLEDTLFKKSE